MSDSIAQLKLWQQLAEPQAQDLITQASDVNPSDVAAVSRLRKTCDADLLHLVLDLVKARQKAKTKWPENIAANLFADSQGVEQATSQIVSSHKAKRFAKLGKPVMDLCCGIGGDAMGFTQAGLTVIGIDMDPSRAWMTKKNAHCQTVAMDINNVELDQNHVFHIDPARRNQHGRTHNIADYQPGLEVMQQLLTKQPTGCFKLGPGVNLDCLEDELAVDVPCEIEIISEHGSLVQAVLWTGDLAQCARRATLLPEGLEVAATEDEVWEEPPQTEIKKFVMTFDASVERLGLMAMLCNQLDVACIHPQAGLLTSDELTTTPWIKSFEVLADLPWKIKPLKAALRKLDAGIVEVKTRAKLVNPDLLQKQLRGKGDQLLTVFILRFGKQSRAIVTKRC